MAAINDLPVEVLRRIFLFLDPKSFLQVTHVSKYWRQLSLWRYTLFWHIDWYLADQKDPFNFYKCYDIIRQCDPIHSSDDSSLDQSPTTNSSSLTKISDAPSFPTLTYDRYIKCFGDQTSHPERLTSNKSLVFFYHRLLKFQLVGLNFSSLYTLNLPHFFFDNTPHDPQSKNSHSQIIECVTFSPDCLYLLVVKRGVDNYHFLHGYQLVDPSKAAKSFKPFLKFYYCWKNDREVDQVVFSTDNSFLGVSYNVGFVEVHDLCVLGENRSKMSLNTHFSLSPNNDPSNYNTHDPYSNQNNCTSIYPRETILLFSRQYPSNINYLAISACGEVLFLRSQRLGGLIIVNIEEAIEIDIPHYRLDLTMSLQYHDKVLMLFGWNESIIFGKATHSSPPEDTQSCQNQTTKSNTPHSTSKQQGLWDYYLYLIENNISSYVPLEKAIALPKTNTYLGLDCIQEEDVLTLKVLLDEDELYGFKSIEDIRNGEEITAEKEEDSIYVTANEEDEDQEKLDANSPSSITLPEAQINGNGSVNISPDGIVQDSEGVGEEEEENGVHRGSEEDEDEDEEADTRLEFSILKSISSRNRINYCLTQDSTRLAVLQNNKIHIFLLYEQCLDYGFVTKYLPHRTIDIDLHHLGLSKTDDIEPRTEETNQNIDLAATIKKLLFIQNDYLLIMTTHKVHVLQISSLPTCSSFCSIGEPQLSPQLEFDSGLFVKSKSP